MKKIIFITLLIHSFMLSAQFYQANLESIDSRAVPDWFPKAKFGIFVHWGVYSIPAYRPAEQHTKDGPITMDGSYAEWYAPDVMYKPARNDSFHIKVYGRDFSYFDFAAMFKPILYDPGYWADLFKAAGAKYVILTSKHCDGYCMWPTKDHASKNWNVGETGPHRDLLGDLTKAVRSRGMKMGYYYSLMEYWSTKTTQWPANPAERTGYYVPKQVYEKYHLSYNAQVGKIHNHIKYLVIKYKPDILWADAELDGDADYWKTLDLISWILNYAPNKDNIVLNDRWFAGCRGKHVGYYTTEYGDGMENVQKKGQMHPWEECQGMGYSFGYNRAENIYHYKTAQELINLLIQTVANGGNLLLNVGPAADGTIPVIMQQRLLEIGDWLKVNGDAIYETEAYGNKMKIENVHPDAGKTIFLTKKNKDLYVIVTKWYENPIELRGVQKGTSISMLGSGSVVLTEEKRSSLTIYPPQINPARAPCLYAYVYKIAGCL
jgi:alpha-L-fucosidase